MFPGFLVFIPIIIIHVPITFWCTLTFFFSAKTHLDGNLENVMVLFTFQWSLLNLKKAQTFNCGLCNINHNNQRWAELWPLAANDKDVTKWKLKFKHFNTDINLILGVVCARFVVWRNRNTPKNSTAKPSLSASARELQWRHVPHLLCLYRDEEWSCSERGGGRGLGSLWPPAYSKW